MRTQIALIALVALQSATALKVALKKQKSELSDYVVCNKDDGFGAQFHCQMAAFAVARKKGVCFIFNKFWTSNFHNAGMSKEQKAKFVEESGKFSGLHSDAGCTSTGHKYKVDHPKAAEGAKGESADLFYTPEVRAELRKMYMDTAKPEVDSSCQVAIHVRRGDVKHGSRFTSNAVIADAIERNFKDKTVCIFSEGKGPEDFKQLMSNKNIKFKLNQPTDEAFHGLVSAPELLIARSSFSYAAGVINPGKVYYLGRFWHKELDAWTQVQLSKSFSRQSIEALEEPPVEDKDSEYADFN